MTIEILNKASQTIEKLHILTRLENELKEQNQRWIALYEEYRRVDDLPGDLKQELDIMKRDLCTIAIEKITNRRNEIQNEFFIDLQIIMKTDAFPGHLVENTIAQGI